jgi:hypothetical protein
MNRYPSGRFVAALVAAWLVSVALTACVPDKPCKRWGVITTYHMVPIGNSMTLIPMSTSYCQEYEK